jgi:tetratricopeptide (TPR) repeat protein
VEDDAGAAGRLARELGGAAVLEHVPGVAEAQAALRARGFDALVLAHPLADTDLVAACAALRDGPGAPPLLLFDRAGDAGSLGALLPEAMRPARVLPGAPDAGKLAQALAELDGASADDAGETLEPEGASFAELLVALRDGRETGTLEVRADGLCTVLTLDRGVPVFAEGGRLRDTLGRLLLRRGEITEDEYVRVIERMTQRLVENEPLRMGEVLVELGLLEPSDVFEALRDQVREKILSCFQWPRFQALFHTLDALPEGAASFPCPSFEALVLEGLSAHASPAQVDALLATRAAAVPHPPSDFAGTVERLGLRGADLKLLRALDGRRSVAELRRAGLVPAPRGDALLATLLVTHAVEVAAAGAVPGPARAGDPSGRAGEVPTAAPRGEPPVRDESRARLEAESAFQRGLALLQAEKFAPSRQAFAEALARRPHEPEYAMHEAWAGYLAARVELALARARVRGCAMRVAQLDAQAARPHAILGRVALDEGRFDEAARELEAAILRDPEDRDARRGLRELEASGRRGPRRPPG